MNYRRFGKLAWKASALGFGAMRLPLVGSDNADINEPEAIRMIRYAIDHGVNYVDTAYVYHRGKSEVVVGKALRDGYREKVRLATKMPTWRINSEQDMQKYLNEQLDRLQTNRVDFYLLHGLNQKTWDKVRQLNVLEWLENKVDEGKIGYLGFSFHDEYNAFKNIVDGYAGWTFCQIQYNYVDADYQAGTKGLEYAASKGLGIVVMEPIAGGKLAINPPTAIQTIWDQAEIKRTPAEWALRWVWNRPEVSVVLSGMSTMEQVIENVNSTSNSNPDDMTRKELALIEQVRKKYEELGYTQCTGCRYCMPCPEGVNIPEIMSLHNEYYVKDRADEIKSKYWEHITPESQAKRCVRCGRCEELCPQKMPIRSILSEAAFIFESKP
jgi:hypothetical protein